MPFGTHDSEIKKGYKLGTCLQISIWSRNEMRKSLEEEKDWRSKETVAERTAGQRKSSLEQDKKTALAMKGAWIKGSKTSASFWTMTMHNRRSDVPLRPLLPKGPIGPVAGALSAGIFQLLAFSYFLCCREPP